MADGVDIRGSNGSRPELSAVPGLDQIAANPRSATGLPQRTLRDLLRRNAVVQSALVVELEIANEVRREPTKQESDNLLTVKEAALMLRRKPRWIYRNAHRLPFVRRVSPKSLLCSGNGIKRWLERQR